MGEPGDVVVCVRQGQKHSSTDAHLWLVGQIAVESVWAVYCRSRLGSREYPGRRESSDSAYWCGRGRVYYVACCDLEGARRCRRGNRGAGWRGRRWGLCVCVSRLEEVEKRGDAGLGR